MSIEEINKQILELQQGVASAQTLLKDKSIDTLDFSLEILKTSLKGLFGVISAYRKNFTEIEQVSDSLAELKEAIAAFEKKSADLSLEGDVAAQLQAFLNPKVISYIKRLEFTAPEALDERPASSATPKSSKDSSPTLDGATTGHSDIGKADTPSGRQSVRGDGKVSVPLSRDGSGSKPTATRQETSVAGGESALITEENITKVEASGAPEKIRKSIRTLFENYQRQLKAGGGGDSFPKLQEKLINIIKMPGWGVTSDPNPLVYITHEQAVELRERAEEAIRKSGLPGTEGITDYALGLLNKRLLSMVDEENVGKPIPVDKIKRMQPVVIDGPPGTGKTSVAKLVAKILNFGYVKKSMAGKNEGHEIFGRGPQWGAPAPGAVSGAMIASGRSDVVILFDEAEKTNGDDIVNALGDVLEVGQSGYNDAYFDDSLIDKRRAFCVLTTNYYDELKPHIKSRVLKLELPGYSNDAKYRILVAMLKGKLSAVTATKFDKNVRIPVTNKSVADGSEQFVLADDAFDAVEFLVKNYITEPGVREAEQMLERLLTAAQPKLKRGESLDQQIVFTEKFIRDALGEPKVAPYVHVRNEKILEVGKLEAQKSAIFHRALEEGDDSSGVQVPRELQEHELLDLVDRRVKISKLIADGESGILKFFEKELAQFGKVDPSRRQTCEEYIERYQRQLVDNSILSSEEVEFLVSKIEELHSLGYTSGKIVQYRALLDEHSNALISKVRRNTEESDRYTEQLKALRSYLEKLRSTGGVTSGLEEEFEDIFKIKSIEDLLSAIDAHAKEKVGDDPAAQLKHRRKRLALLEQYKRLLEAKIASMPEGAERTALEETLDKVNAAIAKEQAEIEAFARDVPGQLQRDIDELLAYNSKRDQESKKAKKRAKVASSDDDPSGKLKRRAKGLAHDVDEDEEELLGKKSKKLFRSDADDEGDRAVRVAAKSKLKHKDKLERSWSMSKLLEKRMRDISEDPKVRVGSAIGETRRDNIKAKAWKTICTDTENFAKDIKSVEVKEDWEATAKEIYKDFTPSLSGSSLEIVNPKSNIGLAFEVVNKTVEAEVDLDQMSDPLESDKAIAQVVEVAVRTYNETGRKVIELADLDDDPGFALRLIQAIAVVSAKEDIKFKVKIDDATLESIVENAPKAPGATNSIKMLLDDNLSSVLPVKVLDRFESCVGHRPSSRPRHKK